MNKFLLIGFVFSFVLIGCSSNKNDKIELTCIDKVSPAGSSFNLTVIPPSDGHKGKVYRNDRDQDMESDGSKQVISDLKINQSVVSWSQKFEVLNSDIKSSQAIEISRNTGLLTRTEFLLTPQITYTYSQCEPRRSNKF
jgi:hypothetical protein